MWWFEVICSSHTLFLVPHVENKLLLCLCMVIPVWVCVWVRVCVFLSSFASISVVTSFTPREWASFWNETWFQKPKGRIFYSCRCPLVLHLFHRIQLGVHRYRLGPYPYTANQNRLQLCQHSIKGREDGHTEPDCSLLHNTRATGVKQWPTLAFMLKSPSYLT